jgi:hypothetical protein
MLSDFILCIKLKISNSNVKDLNVLKQLEKAKLPLVARVVYIID